MVKKKLTKKAHSATALPRQQREPKKKRWIRLPYLGHSSAKLSKLVKSYGYHLGLHNINSTMTLLWKRKDPIPRSERSEIYILNPL